MVPPVLSGALLTEVPEDLGSLWHPVIAQLPRSGLIRLMQSLWEKLNEPLNPAVLSLASLWFREIWKAGHLSDLGLSNPFLR